MKIPKIPAILNDLKSFMIEKSPEILMGVGITGMVTSTILGIRATPTALYMIEEEKARKGVDELTKKETVELVWKCYAPTILLSGVSISCIIGAGQVNSRRNMVLSTAYTLSESALKEFQEKAIETVGENKVQAIRDSIARDRMTSDPVTSKEVIITERGNTLCYDGASGRYFKSDMDTLKKTEACLNLRLRNEMYIPLNDFYYEIGLPATSIGDDLGWHVDDGYVELKFGSQIASDGNPCLVVDYKISLLPPIRA
jgi:hypothetical protein